MEEKGKEEFGSTQNILCNSWKYIKLYVSDVCTFLYVFYAYVPIQRFFKYKEKDEWMSIVSTNALTQMFWLMFRLCLPIQCLCVFEYIYSSYKNWNCTIFPTL